MASTRYADVESMWVHFKYGMVSCVVLMHSDGSISELRGGQMFSWLRDWSLLFRTKLEAAYKSEAKQLTLLPSTSEPQPPD